MRRTYEVKVFMAVEADSEEHAREMIDAALKEFAVDNAYEIDDVDLIVEDDDE